MNKSNTSWIKSCIDESRKAVDSLERQMDKVAEACALILGTFKSGCKVLSAGNGGSAAEAMHLAEEATGRFRGNRVALPAIALCADGTALTCIGNDFGFDRVFSRQVEAFGREGDLLVLFSTSGNSANLEFALEAAKARNMRTLAILGKTGGRLAGCADLEIVIEGTDSGRIQEAHQLLMHILLDAVEREFAK